MIEIFSSLIFFIILAISAGLFFLRYVLSVDSNIFRISEIGLIGISFLTFLSFLIHFILPLNTNVNLIVAVFLILAGIFKNINFFINNLIKDFLIFSISLVVVFVMTLNYNPHEDYGYYHLPYMINLISEKNNFWTFKSTTSVWMEFLMAKFFIHVFFTNFRFKWSAYVKSYIIFFHSISIFRDSFL